MRINGKEVVFGSIKRECRDGARWQDYAHYHVRMQRWNIPDLELSGSVNVENSLTDIRDAIQREVNFDLENREKRKLGLPTWSYPSCCKG
jgi:hypothetical protein